VQKSEDARIAYERQNQIWTLDDKQNITTQRLSDVNKQLTDAQSERNEEGIGLPVCKVGQSRCRAGGSKQFRARRFVQKAQRGLVAIHRRFEPIWPQFPQGPSASKLKLKEFDQSIEKEKQKILDVLASGYHEAQQRETLLTQALDQQKAETNQMAGKLVEYNILKREAEANKTFTKVS